MVGLLCQKCIEVMRKGVAVKEGLFACEVLQTLEVGRAQEQN